MPLVFVREAPPYLRLDVTSSKTGLDVTNAGVCGIKGGLVYQMDIDRWTLTPFGYKPCTLA